MSSTYKNLVAQLLLFSFSLDYLSEGTREGHRAKNTKLTREGDG